jgi:hypothetical protein
MSGFPATIPGTLTSANAIACSMFGSWAGETGTVRAQLSRSIYAGLGQKPGVHGHRR